jgi:sigma-B regulation protein RsbU (phosphoserine phosphatase)
MRWRLIGLLVVACLVLAYRGTGNYLRYLSADLRSTLPMAVMREGDHLVVQAVDLRAAPFHGWGQPERPKPGDRVVEIYDHDGRGGAVKGLFDYGRYIKPINVREPWTLVVSRPCAAGEYERLAIKMPPSVRLRWTPAEWLASLAIDFYLPFLAAMAGLLIALVRPRDDQACLAALLFMALGVTMGPGVSQFPSGLRELSLFVEVTGSHFLPYLVFLFFLRFPTRSPVDQRAPWLNAVFLVVTLAAWGAGLVWDFSKHVSFAAASRVDAALAAAGLTVGVLESVFTAFGALMIVVALVSVVLNARRAGSADERRRLRIIAAGAVAGLLPAAVLLALATARVKVPMGVWLVGIPLIGLFPLSFAYAVVRHRVFGIRLILRRGLKYALVSRGFLVAEAAVIFVALLWVAGSLFSWLGPQPGVAAASAGTALVTYVLTLGMRRVNRQVLPVIDRRFFRDAYDARRILTDLGRAVRQLASRPEQLLERVTREIDAALHPTRVAVFLRPGAVTGLAPLRRPYAACWDAGADRFELYVDELPGAADMTLPAGERVLSTRSPLARHLAACAAGEPEALDVIVFESALSGPPAEPSWAGDASSPPVSRCLADEQLLERFEPRLVVPLATGGRVLGFILLGEKLSEEPYGREDKELLVTVADQVAIALDYAHLIEQAAEQAALRREVQIAQEVQSQLFPRERPALRTLRYAGVCRAARGVGGDFYDFLPLTADRLGVALADIAGKGLPAALLMASLQALLRSHAPTHACDLGALGRELNRHLVETSDGARFATLFFGVYDDCERTLRYLNAGHIPPVVVRRDGVDGVRRLDPGGMVLGLFPSQQYEEQSVVLEPGDRLVVFTDGVTEAEEPGGEMFGEERLLESVRRLAHLPAEELPARLLAEVTAFVGPSHQQDDITVITAEVV